MFYWMRVGKVPGIPARRPDQPYLLYRQRKGVTYSGPTRRSVVLLEVSKPFVQKENKKDATRNKQRPRRAIAMDNLKYWSDFFSLPPGVEPTTTMRMLYGAYQSAKMIEAVENRTEAAGFVQKMACPGSPKVFHPLSKSTSCKELTILDSVITAMGMLFPHSR